MTQGIDVTKLTLMLNELRLPTIKQLWPTFAERSDKEGWPAARFLSAITEHEIAERGRRRMERHLAEARSEEHTSELQSLMRSSYAVFCLKKNKTKDNK